MRVHARSGASAAGIATAVLAAFCCTALSPAPAHTAEGASAYVSAGLTGGAALPDGDLANYQWDVRPDAAWGAIALAGRGAFAAGVRVSTWRTTQQVSASPITSAAVRSTAFEGVGRVTLGRILGASAGVSASAGRMAIVYTPGAIEVGGAGTVTLEPIHEWIGGAGFFAQRPLARGWSAGLSLDREFHALDTAHRRGAEVVYGRETFGTWNARFELTRTFALHGKGTTR